MKFLELESLESRHGNGNPIPSKIHYINVYHIVQLIHIDDESCTVELSSSSCLGKMVIANRIGVKHSAKSILKAIHQL